AVLSVLCNLAMAESGRMLDAPYTLAHGLVVLSYTVVLGGTLLDNARLFDQDGLKKINDRYGHLTGTKAIKRLAIALKNGSRAIDTPARYGGDEFALI